MAPSIRPDIHERVLKAIERVKAKEEQEAERIRNTPVKTFFWNEEASKRGSEMNRRRSKGIAGRTLLPDVEPEVAEPLKVREEWENINEEM